MIDGVQVIPLRQIHDPRGKVMHMLRSTDPHFIKFGDIYFSTAYPGVIKAWHRHSVKVLNYAVVQGMIRLVLFDGRDNSTTKGQVQEVFLGPENYNLAIIPPGIWYGFQAIGTETAIVADCATEPHDPAEQESLPSNSNQIPFAWIPIGPHADRSGKG